MSVRILSVLACVLCCSVSYAEEPVEIPLDQIWARDMPGTKDIYELEPDRERFHNMSSAELIKNSLVENTRWLLNANFRPPEGNGAERGFVVTGNGLEALKQANEILAKKTLRKESFPSEIDLTLVFFSYTSARNVNIDSVTKKEDEIILKYHFHDSGQMTSTAQIALIPIGKFSEGKTNVLIERLSDTGRPTNVLPLDRGTARRLICDSFTFKIEKSRK